MKVLYCGISGSTPVEPVLWPTRLQHGYESAGAIAKKEVEKPKSGLLLAIHTDRRCPRILLTDSICESIFSTFNEIVLGHSCPAIHTKFSNASNYRRASGTPAQHPSGTRFWYTAFLRSVRDQTWNFPNLRGGMNAVVTFDPNGAGAILNEMTPKTFQYRLDYDSKSNQNLNISLAMSTYAGWL
ncbi:hypothetical protein EVAR_54530_1 [Eumeta japonica]|uniref:Uncharacterized protein n=1 Tax=Eumeta variegata TaxID=151549 RepID=A0A4C1YM22_EUMVA|nr:hypothetical protein EVAR_54530_1 [Eumeta japonica]